jgi:hypothetical protein
MRTRLPVNYDAIAHLYDEQPYRAKKVDPELSAFAKQRASSGGLSILDIACGTGSQLVANRAIVPDARLVGLSLRPRGHAGAGRQNIRMMLLVTPAKPALAANRGPVPRPIWIPAFEAVRKSTIAWFGVVRPSRRPLRGLLRACEEIGRFPDPSRRVLPRPACGERGGVRGLLTVAENPANTRAPLPLTRNPRADALIPTSPRKRGEVAGRDANSFTSSQDEEFS